CRRKGETAVRHILRGKEVTLMTGLLKVAALAAAMVYLLGPIAAAHDVAEQAWEGPAVEADETTQPALIVPSDAAERQSQDDFDLREK
ncbi:MAG TPA: hypothetical protein VFM39_02715, partial [bacterium]|nr:hypothetical protein [bacterium]